MVLHNDRESHFLGVLRHPALLKTTMLVQLHMHTQEQQILQILQNILDFSKIVTR